MNRIGNYIITHSGRPFWPLDPRPEDVCIRDIAHALSQINRFGGHSRFPYSVAQHSYLCSLHAPDGYELEALLHDATEAYCSDVVRPLKEALPAYRDIERGIWANAIAPAFGLNYEISAPVHQIDTQMLVTEGRQLLAHGVAWWDQPHFPAPLDVQIRAMDPITAKMCFLRRYQELTGGEVAA